MGTQMIKQDDGKFGLFSTISDRIYAIDCDEAEMIQIWKDRAAERAEEEMKRWLEETKGKRPAMSKPITLKQALRDHQFHDNPKLLESHPEYKGEFDFDEVLRKRQKELKKGK